jgi:hypothetical protein
MKKSELERMVRRMIEESRKRKAVLKKPDEVEKLYRLIKGTSPKATVKYLAEDDNDNYYGEDVWVIAVPKSNLVATYSTSGRSKDTFTLYDEDEDGDTVVFDDYKTADDAFEEWQNVV